MFRLEFSFDDGHKLDLKVARLLEKHGFRGMFYIPSKKLYKDKSLITSEINMLVNRGHRIGGHTVNHPMDMKLLSHTDIDFEVRHNKDCLTELLLNKNEITSFCYPRGRYDERVISALKVAGYKEARTTVVHCTDLPQDNFRKDTTIHLFQRPEYQGRSILDEFKTYLKVAESKEALGYFHIWGHSWEIEKYDLWDTFEEMLEILKEKGYADLY